MSDQTAIPGCRNRWQSVQKAQLNLLNTFVFGVLALMLSIIAAPTSAQANSKYAAIVVDADTGNVLFSRRADSQRYPASLTKMMTLYMLFESLEKGDLTMTSPLTTSARAAGQSPSKLNLKPGQKIKVRDAILALVVRSANDVAVVVAEELGGTEANFAKLMTRKAREIGMTKTTFRNASGLPNSRQLTTARDMYTLGLRLQQHFPQFYGFFATDEFTWGARTYRSHNKLVGKFRGTDGIKTGYTRASGFNLVASVRRDNRHLIGVVMGGKSSRTRNQHMRDILTRGFVAVAKQPVPKTAISAAPPIPKARPTKVQLVGVAPRPKPGEEAQGDTDIHDPSEGHSSSNQGERVASLTATPGIQPAFGQPAAAPTDDWQVQIGAYSDEFSAVSRLDSARRAARGALDGKTSTIVPITASNETLYRARFGNFTEEEAVKVCESLQQNGFLCFKVKADQTANR